MILNFQEEVRRRFRFVESDYGLHEMSAPQNETSWEDVVVYISDKVRLEVFREHSPQEVGVRFKDLRAHDESTWYFATYLTLVDRELAQGIGGSVAKSEADVLELLERYSEALQTRGEPILRGDSKEFAGFRDALRTGKGLEPLKRPLRFAAG